MNEEEKEAIKEVKEIIDGDYEYPSILNEIKKTNYGNKDLIELWNATDDESSNYEEYTDLDIAKAIVYLVNLVDKQQKEIEEKEKVIDEMAKKLVDLQIPISQEEDIMILNYVKRVFYKKTERKIEELASNEHSRWANWQKYVHSICIKNEDGSLTIPKEYVEHWEYEINTEYKDLPEKIKESDRKEVRQILELLGE